MPACKVGCCPDDVCDCSNDCECLLPGDADLSPGVGFENPFLIAEHNLKGEPDGNRLKICPCRTKEELTDYVKPIEARLHGDQTGEKNDDLNSPKKQDVSKNANPDMVDKCCETSDHIGTHASHGHEDKCCDDGTCTKTAEKDRGSTQGKTSTGCCEDESCEKKCDSPPGNEEHHTAAKSCCNDKSCEGEGELKIGHQQEKCGTGSCCAGKPSKEAHEHSKPTGESCCNDKNCEATKFRQEKPKDQDSCCNDKSCEANKPSKKDSNTSSSNSCCEDKSCGASTPSQEPHKHSRTAASCCGQKSCEVPAKETDKHPQCCEGKGSKSCQSKTLPRTNSLPTNNVSPNPNSPTRIAKAPNFEIKSNFSFEEKVSPVPYRKTRRSQSLAEARLGSLLNERRPSCFQLSTQELRQGLVPDPHRGHGHHHAHEYHHSKSCRHHHRGNRDHHHGNDDHHHGDHDDGDRDDHDDSHHHGNDSCCQGNDSTDRNSCCEDPKCGDESPNSIEETKPLMKSEGSKVDVGEMVVRTTKLRVQNMCCPKEGQIVHDELRKLEVCLLNFLRSPLFVFVSTCMLQQSWQIFC